MTKPKYEIVDRKDFLAKRYANFKANKPEFERLIKQGFPIIYTDLDKDYGDGVMKDRVLCDRCNEWIDDPIFVMAERSRVYHLKCIASELPSGMDLNNVTVVDFGENKV